MFDGLMVDAWSVRPDVIVGRSELIWSIAADPSGRYAPNILSELEYRDMHSYGAGVTFARLYPVNDDLALYADAQINNSNIHSGTSQDSDYAANNRQQEFSRSYADIANDDMSNYGFSIGLKSQWLNTGKNFLSFYIGREQQDVNITASKGVIVISNALPAGQRLDDLNSTYDSHLASWKLGVGAEHSESWGTISLRYDYYDTNFDANARWNLRQDLEQPVSFTHNGQGDGHGLQINYRYPLCGNLSLNTQWSMIQYRISRGYDQTFFSNNGTPFSYVTQLNSVSYEKKALQVGIEYWF
jgi:hypothetical protein